MSDSGSVCTDTSSNISDLSQLSLDDSGESEPGIVGIQPYAFEPEESDSGEDFDHHEEVGPQDAGVDVGREEDADVTWCTCGHCRQMDRRLECCCCQEREKLRCKITEAPGEELQCITMHPGFRAVCLDVWVLQTAYFAYRQQYGNHNVPIHKQYRYTAYRQLVRWCWGYLGRHNRIVLPSCAVSLIRETFPSAEYAGFSYPVLED